MSVKTYPEIVTAIAPDANVYLFAIQARNGADAAAPALTLGQIEAARNAAAAVLETTGAAIASTCSIIEVDAPTTPATLTILAEVITPEA
ncbi:MAG: hypothetical protein IJL92_08770 [Thermoguttaceae bacterium]|nr:hypothetical protein [Thermoguttaceae bacterium]